MNIHPSSFQYEERRAVATITFDRPDRLNSLTFEVYRELTDTLAKLRSREQVRVVVIAGRERGFCSGGDVEEIIGELFSRDMSVLLEFTRMTCELFGNIRALLWPMLEPQLTGWLAHKNPSAFEVGPTEYADDILSVPEWLAEYTRDLRGDVGLRDRERSRRR